MPASELYALGGTMHYLLTGCDPEPITASRPRSIRSTLSPAINDVIAKATCPKLAGRYETAEEMRKELWVLGR